MEQEKEEEEEAHVRQGRGEVDAAFGSNRIHEYGTPG